MILKRKIQNKVTNSYISNQNEHTAELPLCKKRTTAVSNEEERPNKQTLSLKGKPDLQINRYPFLEYLVSFAFFLFCVYIFASITGIPWGIPTFQKKEWWHFAVGGVAFAFGIGVMFNADFQTFGIIKSANLLYHKTFKCFCLFQNTESYHLNEITNISIVQSGTAKKVSLHSRWYGSEISFINCRKITVLKCISQENAILYRDRIVGALSNELKKRIETVQKLRTQN